VDVPAQRRAHDAQHLWMVDEAGERRLEADEAERVHGTVLRRPGVPADALDERRQPAHLGGCEHVGQHQEAVALEAGELSRVGRWHASDYGRGSRRRPGPGCHG
jgi:hypothetical protein